MDISIYFVNKDETILMEFKRNKAMDSTYFHNLTLLIDALCAGHFCYHPYNGYRDDLIVFLNSQENKNIINIELTRDGINFLS
jgi:hypothetical protein